INQRNSAIRIKSKAFHPFLLAPKIAGPNTAMAYIRNMATIITIDITGSYPYCIPLNKSDSLINLRRNVNPTTIETERNPIKRLKTLTLLLRLGFSLGVEAD